mgnify:FL=1
MKSYYEGGKQSAQKRKRTQAGGSARSDLQLRPGDQAGQQHHAGRQEGCGPEGRLRCFRHHQGEDREGPPGRVHHRSGEHHAVPGGQGPPRGRRHLPGAHRGSPRAPSDPWSAVADQLLPRPQREDHEGAAGRRDHGCRQQPRLRGQEARGHPQDGRVQQGLRALSLVIRS